MTTDPASVSLEDLSAYIDGELHPSRCVIVERHLTAHPDAAAWVAEYRYRDDALRLAFAEIGADPSQRTNPRARPARGLRRYRFRWAVAAAILGLILGIGEWRYGGVIHDDLALSALARDAAAAHLLYTRALSRTRDTKQMSARLSALLGNKVRAPDLSTFGFHLVGLRELAADEEPAALLIYRDARGEEVSCYFKRLANPRESGLKREVRAGITILYGLDEHLGYAVSGALPPGELQAIAEKAYRDNADVGN